MGRLSLVLCFLLLCGAAIAAPASGAPPPPPPASDSDSGQGKISSLCFKQANVLINQLSTTTVPLNKTTASQLITALVEECTGVALAPPRPISILSPEEGRIALVRAAAMFERATGFKVDAQYKTFAEISAEILRSFSLGLKGLYQGFHYDSPSQVDLYTAGALMDLRPYLGNYTNTLGWSDIIPHIRDSIAVFDGKVLGLPEAVLLSYFYYRRDLLAPLNITSVPSTWDELLEVAYRINGTDIDGDGKPEYAFCIPLMRDAREAQVANMFQGILASMTVYDGQQQGYMFEPLTLEPLVNTEAGIRALEIHKAIFSMTAPEKYDPFNSTFLYGKCMFTLRLSDIFKFSQNNRRLVSGKVGCMPYPGSSRVLDRVTGKLVPCTATLCRERAQRPNGTLYYNMAPYGGYTFAGAVNPASDPLYLRPTLDLIVSTLLPSVIDDLQILAPYSPVGPLRMSHLQPSVWTSRRYNETDVTDFLAATNTIINHPNIFMELRMIKATELRAAISDACLLATVEGWDARAAAQFMYDQLKGVLANTGYDMDTVKRTYWVGINFTPPSPPPPSPLPPAAPPPMVQSSSKGVDAKVIAPSVVVPTVVVGLLLVGLCFLFGYVRRSQHRSLWGKVLAPTGPGTAMVITDIESSTLLWDVLDGQIMDEVLHLHHEVMRQQCYLHRGYESGTEGDSFILAFHTAADAVRFSVSVQEALMECPWPEELLAMPLCKPLWIVPVAQKQRKLAHNITLGKAAGRQRFNNLLQGSPSAGFFGGLNDGSVFGTGSEPFTGTGTAEEVSDNPDRDSTHTEASTVASAAAAAAASPAPGPPPRTSASGRGTLYTSALQRAHRASNPGNGSIAAANIPGLTINTGVSTNPTGNSGPPTATAATVAINNPLAGPTQPPPARRSAPGLPQLQAPSPFATNSLNPLIVQHGDGEHEEDEDHTSLHGGSQPGPNLAAQHSVAQESSLVEGPDRGSDHSSSSTPAMAANTVGRHIERSSTVVDGPGPGRIQLFRGLRVRIGVHTGLDDEEIQAWYNRSVGRTQYTGAILKASKVVQDAAQGGMVLLSEATKEHLQLEGGDAIVVAHMGEHVLEGGATLHLYTAFRDALMFRLGYMGPVRSVQPKSAGFLSAPYGEAAICFMNVVGLGLLQAHNLELSRECLGIYRSIAQDELRKQGGYLVEETDGLELVAFPRASHSIRWALNTIKQCLEAEWPEDLLSHELGEEIGVGGVRSSIAKRFDKPTYDGVLNNQAPGYGAVLLRGLRLKCGIDAGKVSASVHATLGRMTYRGRVMNRSSRISGVAKTGQVWCSETAWMACLNESTHRGIGHLSFSSSFISAASNDGDPVAEHISVTPLGPHKLKGVQGDVELMHCHFEHDTLLAGGARDGRGNSSFSVKPSAVSLTRRANSGSSLRPLPPLTLPPGKLEEGEEEGEQDSSSSSEVEEEEGVAAAAGATEERGSGGGAGARRGSGGAAAGAGAQRRSSSKAAHDILPITTVLMGSSAAAPSSAGAHSNGVQRASTSPQGPALHGLGVPHGPPHAHAAPAAGGHAGGLHKGVVASALARLMGREGSGPGSSSAVAPSSEEGLDEGLPSSRGRLNPGSSGGGAVASGLGHHHHLHHHPHVAGITVQQSSNQVVLPIAITGLIPAGGGGPQREGSLREGAYWAKGGGLLAAAASFSIRNNRSGNNSMTYPIHVSGGNAIEDGRGGGGGGGGGEGTATPKSRMSWLLSGEASPKSFSNKQGAERSGPSSLGAAGLAATGAVRVTGSPDGAGATASGPGAAPGAGSPAHGEAGAVQAGAVQPARLTSPQGFGGGPVRRMPQRSKSMSRLMVGSKAPRSSG